MLTGKITAIIIAIFLATSTTVVMLVTIIAIVLQPWDMVRVRPTSTPVETGTPAATPDAAATPVITQTPDITMTVTPEITATPDVTTTVTPTLVYSDKVTICHIPPGNSNAAHNITISQSAFKAHLGHGDTVGPCVNPGLIIDVIVLTGTVDYEAGIAIDLDGILVPGYRGGDSDDDDDDDHGGGGGGRHGDHDRGHGNDSDHHDEDNPGRSGHK